ncbi:MAG: metallophosphoesterase [Firmicutes bacterium]|nr:metallophosphoesterase [Bacillota bacterium]
MKILVLSDTHGLLDNAYKITDKIKTEIYAIIHLGDYDRDADTLRFKYPDLKVFSVAGNCDYSDYDNTERIINLGGVKIFMTHGHTYHVNSGVMRLAYAAMEKEADIALYGHTHSAFISREDGILIMNPGSISSPRGTNICSYGILDIEDGFADAKIMGIYDNGIREMKVEE